MTHTGAVAGADGDALRGVHGDRVAVGKGERRTRHRVGQIVVRADLPIKQLADLAGRRVSIGPVNSQTQLVAHRILAAAGVHGEIPAALSLNDSISAMEAGTVDAFFWSGGLPTGVQ